MPVLQKTYLELFKCIMLWKKFLLYHLQIKHAIRTYRSAVSVYKGTTWSHIKDHVHFHIGQ